MGPLGLRVDDQVTDVVGEVRKGVVVDVEDPFQMFTSFLTQVRSSTMTGSSEGSRRAAAGW